MIVYIVCRFFSDKTSLLSNLCASDLSIPPQQGPQLAKRYACISILVQRGRSTLPPPICLGAWLVLLRELLFQVL